MKPEVEMVMLDAGWRDGAPRAASRTGEIRWNFLVRVARKLLRNFYISKRINSHQLHRCIPGRLVHMRFHTDR